MNNAGHMWLGVFASSLPVLVFQELNNPPADESGRVGMFPKSSHQLEAIKKKLPADQITGVSPL